MRIQYIKKKRTGIKNKVDDPCFSKEYRKEIKREIVQKGVTYQEYEEWHTCIK
jgi:hypothetical protein